jgi:hypothetical protein
MEGIIMTDLPNNFADGDELPASAVNQILAARTGDMAPIDDTTRNYTDESGDLGDATYTWKKIRVGELTFADGEIGTTTTDGDIAITPDGDGRVVLGKTLGEWDNSTYFSDTVYQANNDLFVFAEGNTGGSTGLTAIVTDSNATPTTVRQQQHQQPGTLPVSINCVVRKNDYWEVTTTGSIIMSVHVIELGG